MSIRAACLAAALLVCPALASPAMAAGGDALAGAPEPYGSDAPREAWDGHRHMDQGQQEHRWAQGPGRGESGQCYAKVRYGAQYAPPPSGPEYVWRQAPPPPGAPGPIWCLTVQPMPNHPVLISPERYGWVRVLCDDDATPGRISHLQQRLHEGGYYRGAIDGRYDEQTAYAVHRFQSERRIEDRGYLSYATMAALEAAQPAPPRAYWRRPTTIDTGVLTWPGKVIY